MKRNKTAKLISVGVFILGIIIFWGGMFSALDNIPNVNFIGLAIALSGCGVILLALRIFDK